MSSINTSINAFLASNFSEFNRAANSAVNGVGNNPQRRDFNIALGNVKPGTTVRAQFDYTADERGKLVQTGATITVGDEQARKQKSGGGFQLEDERPKSFADLAKPKASLSPSDEIALFAQNATIEADDANVSLRGPILMRDGAEDEEGETLDVELIIPDMDEQQREAQTLAEQKQQKIASLYARNSDVIYNVNPMLELAA